MRHESLSRIDDAIRSIEAISSFIEGKTARDYGSDLLALDQCLPRLMCKIFTTGWESPTAPSVLAGLYW